MANKRMKTLKLPGLADTYTFVQADSTLTQAGEAADAKATGDALTAVQAQVDGVQTQVDGVQAGQYPDMGAGQLLSESGTVNPTPYTYRANASGSDRVTISRITGGTMVWNQSSNISSTGETESRGITRTTYGNGTASFSGTATEDYTWNIGNARTGLKDHIIYLRGCPSGGSTTTYRLQDGYQTARSKDTGDGVIYKITHTNGTTNVQVAIGSGVTVSGIVYAPQAFDLTLMFGATVAEEFLRLETATPGAGIALFRQMFPESYYPYNTGELVSVQTSGRKSGGHTYPLDGTLTLRGIPVLTDGKVAYDGDSYEPDGTVTRRYGVVDLGTLSWTRGQIANSENYRFAATVTGIKGSTTNYLIGGGLYTQVTATSGLAGADMTSLCGSNGFYLRNDAYSTGADFKTAMSGVYMVYELATPTTETAAPYQSVQIAGSTEEFLPPATDTRPAAVPVGSQSLYQTNLREGLETLLDTDLAHAESIAPVQGSTASANIASGELLMQDGKLYKASQAIVTGAEIVPGTNATQTSVADVFKPTVYQLTPQGTGVTLDTTVSNIKVFPVYGLAVLTVKFTVTSSITNYLAFASCTDVRPNMGLGSDDGISVVVANATATKRITLALRPNGWMRVYPADTADNDGTYYATVVYPV